MKVEYPVGILQPTIANRFIFRIHCNNKEVENAFTRQVVSVSLDYVNKELTLVIEQDRVSTTIHEMLFNWADSKLDMFLELVDAALNADTALQITGNMKRHTFDLDYASPGRSAKHLVVFSMDRLIQYETNPD